MSDVIERIAYEIYGLDRSHVGEEYALTVAKAAARMLLEDMWAWGNGYGLRPGEMPDLYPKIDAYARSIGIDLTSPAAPAPEAAQAAGKDREPG